MSKKTSLTMNQKLAVATVIIIAIGVLLQFVSVVGDFKKEQIIVQNEITLLKEEVETIKAKIGIFEELKLTCPSGKTFTGYDFTGDVIRAICN